MLRPLKDRMFEHEAQIDIYATSTGYLTIRAEYIKRGKVKQRKFSYLNQNNVPDYMKLAFNWLDRELR